MAARTMSREPVAYYIRANGTYKPIYSEAMLAALDQRDPGRILLDPFGELSADHPLVVS